MRAEEREAYRLHARLASHRRAVDRAVETVRRAVAEHPGVWACGCSGGKDSTALLDLCVEAGWRGPVFHFRHPETPAENTALAASLASRHGLRFDAADVPGAFDAFAAVGHGFVYAETPAEAAARAAMLAGYKRAAAAAQSALGHAGVFMGVRAEESRARAILVARRGALYRTADRPGWTALPLARWTAADVWARHVSRGLPWLARYDRAAASGDDRGRERSEPVYLAADTAWQHGQGRRLRESDPGLWARLVARWPEFGRFG